MEKEPIYDYSVGLTAPYWIQEIRTKKGKLIASFSVPIQLSYFVVFFLVLIVMLTVLNPIMQFLYLFLRGTVYVLYYYIPNKLARGYAEYDIDGKTMFSYLRDLLFYTIDFSFNKKPIYQSERIDLIQKIRFEKVCL